MPSLFDPIDLGAIHAPNRLLMAPLTRARATDDHVPTPIMAEYYAQRASAGLIISEATGISREGLGWPNAPGLWTHEQVEAWKPVTEAVHKAGGRIVAQLWHMGRLCPPDVIGMQPVSSSATLAPPRPGNSGRNPYAEARPATQDDIARILDDYAAATRNALEAGFDGVQLHGANGYLIDQFLRDNSNFRDDAYGGAPENRIRLLREATQRLIGEAGAGRVSVRLSPNGETQGCDDSDPKSVFVPAARALAELGIGFLELREQAPDGTFGSSDVPKLSPDIRKVFPGPLVLNQDYELDSAQADLDSGLADAIAFGRKFLANPDLPERLRTGAGLNTPNPRTFYAPGAEGYTDYPPLSAAS
ncbi:alkene reductase [Stakelama tenebrarum]|uniref:Alkene reductase n=1 Tax=Stakelama tenebrarum TaxID=2711215 RepID=A0A6G6Y0Q1_9SPHN|nr:alkene reductase [Sphingosinithalassobacter tenebrarum]QIG78490.1 alkene reductase [Sphingosinithalassobacter tenebrarum]